MNILTLNKEQEAKLLELCKAFFPEYKHFHLIKNIDCISYGGDHQVYGWELPIDHVYFRPDESETFDYKKANTIHWYQLCLTELPKRIHTPKCGVATISIMERALLAKHPVDYLYNFWQQNK